MTRSGRRMEIIVSAPTVTRDLVALSARIERTLSDVQALEDSGESGSFLFGYTRTALASVKAELDVLAGRQA